MAFLLTGNDTLSINDKAILNFAGADPVSITFETEVATSDTGKNRNSIISPNRMSRKANVVINLLMGSIDDKFLQSELNSYERDSAAYTLMSGKFVKRLGNGAGAIGKKIINLKGGYVANKTPYKENVQGDISQGISSYTLVFVDSDINDL